MRKHTPGLSISKLFDALICAQSALGDLVREGMATDEQIEAYEEVREAVLEMEGR